LKSDPLMALKFRVGGARAVGVAHRGGLRPMFSPPVVLAALAAFVGLDVLIIARARLAPDFCPAR
jgi:hypothetical protein